MQTIPANWQDWVTVFSYLGFTLFIIACIFVSQK